MEAQQKPIKQEGGIAMKQTLLFPVVLAAIIAVTALLAHLAVVDAQDCRIIRIHGMAAHKSIRIEPEILTIFKGTCVIWLNRHS